MNNARAEVNGFQEQTSVKILHNFISATVFPRNELMEGFAGYSIKGDEGRTLNANSQTQHIFSCNVRG